MSNNNNEPRIVPFTPLHVSIRHDGWTAARQIAFVEALAETLCVDEACRRVGMSDTSAYEFRLSDRGAAFRDAWEAAVEYSGHRVDDGALTRSVRGVPRPIFYKGEQVGEWRHFDERLTMFLLARRERRLEARRQQATFSRSATASIPPRIRPSGWRSPFRRSPTNPTRSTRPKMTKTVTMKPYNHSKLSKLRPSHREQRQDCAAIVTLVERWRRPGRRGSRSTRLNPFDVMRFTRMTAPRPVTALLP